jgi:energy-coupling factor transporter transmembrane protein EcfT
MLLMLRPDLADERFVENRLTEGIARYRHLFFGFLAVLFLVSFNGQWRIGHDSAIYRGLAANIVAGKGYVFGEWASRQAYPGLPYLLAGIQKICGVEVEALRPHGAMAMVGRRIDTTVSTLVMLAMALLTLIVTYRLIRMHYPQWVAVCITFGLGINSWFLELSNSLLTDVPFLLGLVTALYGWELMKRAENARQGAAALALIVPGLALAGTMRPMFWVLGLAWAIVCLWALVRGDRRRFHLVSLAVLLAVWATLIFFDPRHPRGFHPFSGGYERELLDLLPDAHRTLAQRIYQALRDEMPVAFFGEQMSPLSIPASLVALASCALLLRRHPLWAMIVFITFGVTLVLSAESRYYLMVVPMMLLGWLLMLSAIARRFSRGWGLVVLGLGLAIVTGNNLSADIGFVAEQRATPFVQKYERGKYVPLLEMGDLIRTRVGDDERVLAPMAPLLAYVSGKQVLSQREALSRGSLAEYPRTLFEARLSYAVFPAALYRVKEPMIARLMERNILYPIKKIAAVSETCYLSRVRVRVPQVSDWRELPKGWKPPEAKPKPKKKQPTTKVVKRAPATRPARRPAARRPATTAPVTTQPATAPQRRAMTTILSPVQSRASAAVASSVWSQLGVDRICATALSTCASIVPFDDEPPSPLSMKNARAAGPASPRRFRPPRIVSVIERVCAALWYENARSTANPLDSSSFPRFCTLNR